MVDRSKSFSERVELFVQGAVDLYASGIVQDCVAKAGYVRFLGRGGEGPVILIKNTILDRLEVLKILMPGLSQETSKRFFRSAKIVSKLTGESMSLGIQPPFPLIYQINDNPPSIVMQYVNGVTLRDFIEKQPSFDMGSALKIFKEICAGLHLLHTHGIVHRDVKPDNILIDANGKPWIIDFGISKSCYETEYTRTDAMLGTPEYAAPEQLSSAAQVDQRADIYSAAKVLYYLVTKEESFAPENLPIELIMVIPRALQEDRERRYSTMLDFFAAIDEAMPNLHLTGDKQARENPTVAKAFSELLILSGANPGFVKKLLRISPSEMYLWEELMQMAKANVVSVAQNGE